MYLFQGTAFGNSISDDTKNIKGRIFDQTETSFLSGPCSRGIKDAGGARMFTLRGELARIVGESRAEVALCGRASCF